MKEIITIVFALISIFISGMAVGIHWCINQNKKKR